MPDWQALQRELGGNDASRNQSAQAQADAARRQREDREAARRARRLASVRGSTDSSRRRAR